MWEDRVQIAVLNRKLGIKRHRIHDAVYIFITIAIQLSCQIYSIIKSNALVWTFRTKVTFEKLLLLVSCGILPYEKRTYKFIETGPGNVLSSAKRKSHKKAISKVN